MKPDPIYLEISKHELYKLGAAEFIYNVFRRFNETSRPPYTGDGGNLVMMWRKDFEQLLEEAREGKQP